MDFFAFKAEKDPFSAKELPYKGRLSYFFRWMALVLLKGP
jgi:hypothetical protein